MFRAYERPGRRKRTRARTALLTAAACCFYCCRDTGAPLVVVSSFLLNRQHKALRFNSIPYCGVRLQDTSSLYSSYHHSHGSKRSIRNRNDDDRRVVDDQVWIYDSEQSDPLSLQSFVMDLRNIAETDPRRAQDALEVMEQWQDGNWTIQLDVACYKVVIDGYIEKLELVQAQKLLEDMEQRFPDDDGPTKRLAYSDLIQAWVEDFKNDISGSSCFQAESLLRQVQPDVKQWTSVIEGWCKRTGIFSGALAQAENLLEELELSYKQNATASFRPNVLTYTSYIGGLARCRDAHKASKAEAVLDRMERFGVQPDVVAYTSVISCWAKAVSRREKELAASRALRLLSEMEKMYISDQLYNVKPSLITYAAVISAIGNSLDPSAPEMAQDMLDRMYKLRDSGMIANMKPTTTTFNAVIHALSNAPRHRRVRYAKRAEAILSEMMERAENGEKDVLPDVRTWAAVLRAWSRSGSDEAAANAQRVLDQMESMHSEGRTVKPNFVCYTTVMGAHGNSRKAGSLAQMESLLLMMESRYELTQEADIRPNTVSYVTAIDSFVRHGEVDSAERAQATVDRMLVLYNKGLGHVRPTRIVFNTLMHAWSKCKAPAAAEKAEQIFKDMENQYRCGDDLVRPDEVSLCAVLNAWANQARQGGALRAQRIWELTESTPLKERGFPLTITMPNIVIKAISRSGEPDAPVKAEMVLTKLETSFREGETKLRPDVATFSSVINACAYCRGEVGDKREALRIALRTFKKLRNRKDVRPNNITYGTLLKTLANLMHPGENREVLVRRMFDLCAEEGLVDSFVLSQVRKASPSLFRDLLEDPDHKGPTSYDQRKRIDDVLQMVPSTWSSNIVD